MNKIRLYIEDQEIELQEEVQVSITRQFEEISNPTVICNDYTKTVKIPMTAHNNIIFGNIYNPDMISAAVPTNLFCDMVNGNEIIQSDNLFHTNKEYTIRYDHPEILYPVTLYNEYFPSNINLTTLTSYSVFRGIASLTPYETYVPATTELGRHTFTFTLDNTMSEDQRVLTFLFNGTVSLGNLPWVEIDLNNFEDGTYQCSFDTTLFDTTNKQFNLKNLVLTKGSEVVYGNDIANHIGIYFDPFRKLNFRLEWNGDLLMQGYAKMLSAKKENGKGFYEVTLNGELGKIFQEMKKITFDPSASAETDGKYYIDCSDATQVPSALTTMYMTKELVYSGFTTPQSSTDYKDMNNIKVTDVIGFAPCNAFDEDFEYDTFQWQNNEALKFTDVLDSVGFSAETGIDSNTAIPDGMTPRGIGEYRSYLQQPFIYFNKLFRIFQNKAEQITGYKFDLDTENWFNNANPLWRNLVMMLKKLDVKDGKQYFNTYNSFQPTTMAQWGVASSTDYTEPFSGYTKFAVVSEQFPILTNTSYSSRLNTTETMTINAKLNSRIFCGITNSSLNTNNGLLVSLVARGSNNQGVEQKFLIVNENWSGTYTGATILRTSTSVSSYIDVPLIDAYFSIPKDKFGNYVELLYNVNWLYNSFPYSPSTTQVTSYYDIVSSASTINVNVNGEQWLRSGGHFTINNMWNNDHNLFDIILNYCKMYRILIIADVYTKTLKFIPSHKYFENYTVKDWTDKLCTDKDFAVQPITWENKYVLFNYDDAETKLGKEYLEKYGYDYGEKRLITDYNFNEETDELFEGLKPSIVNTDNVLSWTNLYSYKRIVYSFPAETYVHMSDSDGKYVDQFGGFYLYNSTAHFDTAETLNMRAVKITDDTPFQNANNTYFYSQDQNSINVTTYPRLDIVYNMPLGEKRMCVFGKPLLNYTYNTTAYNNARDIYTMIWKKYVEERYNRNNKIVTCYIHLTPYDYINFKFNDFIKIENQLYVVNKIYDYDAVTNQKVKVDLITVQDITGYTTR